MYKAAQGRERVRTKAGSGKDSFVGVNPGGANAATAATAKVGGANAAAAATNSPPMGDAGAEPFAVDELEACFNNLVHAAKAERTTLNELVKGITVLTVTNSKLVAANKN